MTTQVIRDSDSIPDKENLHFVSSVDKLMENGRILLDAEEREIAVFYLDGEFYALSNFCVHQGGPVCEGQQMGTFASNEQFELEYRKENEVVSCPWHGWEFDITNGKCLMDRNYKQPMYDIAIIENDVYLII